MINAHEVWKSYKNLQVLKGLSLIVPKGKAMIILGRSGAGKSVLLKQILGLEKPDSGYIEVDGVKITDLTQTKLYPYMRNFGMLFQSSALFDSMTVGDNVAFNLITQLQFENPPRKIAKSELDDLVEEALKKVGLGGMQKKMPSDLSGGQKRRAALARLIIGTPKVMLFDEPTTGLDPITSKQINELIKQTHEELKATIIVVTHDIHSALDIGEIFALHDDGKIAHVDTKENFIQSDNPLVRNFLETAMIPEKYASLIRSTSE